MNDKRLLLAVAAASAIAACSIGKPVPQSTTYVVDLPANTASASQPRRAEALRMGSVRVAAPYAGAALVYRLDDVRYTSDPYHRFAADPAAMLGSRIAQWLDHSGPFSTVARPGSSRPTPYVLEATIDELYGDFREGKTPAAVLSVQFILIEQAAGRPKVIYERTIARRVDLPKASPDALVRGYSAALAEILTEAAPELGAAIVH
jgi:cholesterol transport system auxiliary component